MRSAFVRTNWRVWFSASAVMSCGNAVKPIRNARDRPIDATGAAFWASNFERATTLKKNTATAMKARLFSNWRMTNLRSSMRNAEVKMKNAECLGTSWNVIPDALAPILHSAFFLPHSYPSHHHRCGSNQLRSESIRDHHGVIFLSPRNSLRKLWAEARLL